MRTLFNNKSLLYINTKILITIDNGHNGIKLIKIVQSIAKSYYYLIIFNEVVLI